MLGPAAACPFRLDSNDLRLYRKVINACRENGQWKSCMEVLRFLKATAAQGLRASPLLYGATMDSAAELSDAMPWNLATAGRLPGLGLERWLRPAGLGPYTSWTACIRTAPEQTRPAGASPLLPAARAGSGQQQLCCWPRCAGPRGTWAPKAMWEPWQLKSMRIIENPCLERTSSPLEAPLFTLCLSKRCVLTCVNRSGAMLSALCKAWPATLALFRPSAFYLLSRRASKG